MNIVPYIFFPFSLGLIIFTFAFFKFPRYAIAGLIIAKPIIDVTWDYHILLNINFLKLYAGLFVILGVIYILIYRPKILRHPLSIIWLIFLGLNVVSIFIISEAHLPLGKINYFLRILTGFVALIIFAYVFDFKKDKKFILSIFIIAGIFPILLWLIPVIMGNPTISNDPLRRIMGPYLNFWNFNFYAIQTLIFCLAYLAVVNKHILRTNNAKSFRKERNHWHLRLFSYLRNSASPKSIALSVMLIISIAMVYKCYSKAGWITIATIFFIWFLLRKKYILTSLIVLITVVILFVDPFTRDFQKTFDNEIEYFIRGSGSKQMVFRGRFCRWGKGMGNFNSLPLINKLLGSRNFVDSPENEYLRILWGNGIVGFATFLFLLGICCYFVIKRYIEFREPVILTGILVLLVFLIGSFGFSSMYYPSLQWLIWGMIGFVAIRA